MIAEIQVGGRFRLGKKIGSGSFGEIFLANDIGSNNQEVAVKLEPISSAHPQLLYEAKIMQSLSDIIGIPKIYWFGIEGDYNILVMELLGPSLEDLFNYCGRKMSLKTVIMVADQLISRVEDVHNQLFIHRDIKPDNFLIGLGKKSSIIHIIDFGLAKRYKNEKTGQHIPYKNGKNLTGTARYASLSTHMGIEQSRKDDLEGICYVMMYLLRGNLPWMGIITKNKDDKYRKIMEIKLSTSIETLCKGFPPELQMMIKYCKTLKFEEDPQYDTLKQFLKDIFISNKIEYDYEFDWNTRANEIIKRSTFAHLINRQNQLARRGSAMKFEEDKKLGAELSDPVKIRRASNNQLQLPYQEQNSLAVNYSNTFQIDNTPVRSEKLEIKKEEDSSKKGKKGGCCFC